MILIDILRLDDWFNESGTIELAKGRHKFPLTKKETFNQYKRGKLWKAKK